MKKILFSLMGALLASSSFASGNVYDIDPAHTFVTFEIGHFNTSTNRARFDTTSGSVYINTDTSEKMGSLDVVVDATSVSSGAPKFLTHLKSHELFNVEKFPAIEFHSTKMNFDKDNKITSIDGNLTLLGTTKPLTITTKNYNCYTNPMKKVEVCGGDFEATLDRTEWGMNYGVSFGFPKTVHLVIQAEAIKRVAKKSE